MGAGEEECDEGDDGVMRKEGEVVSCARVFWRTGDWKPGGREARRDIVRETS